MLCERGHAAEDNLKLAAGPSLDDNPCCLTVLFNLDDLSIVEFRTSAIGDETLGHGCDPSSAIPSVLPFVERTHRETTVQQVGADWREVPAIVAVRRA